MKSLLKTPAFRLTSRGIFPLFSSLGSVKCPLSLYGVNAYDVFHKQNISEYDHVQEMHHHHSSSLQLLINEKLFDHERPWMPNIAMGLVIT
ncbi:hypothetical protein WA026_018956 [Henosepilachna vigintioctopunctata]|uniref:Uncharacterized protein n=1 Tax=Henosepilachna vigintioctopunctata TaxID=420089 RepID=A0AAW1UMT2_9CUCU